MIPRQCLEGDLEIAAAETEEAEDAEVEAEAKATRKKTGTEISDQWRQWQFLVENLAKISIISLIPS